MINRGNNSVGGYIAFLLLATAAVGFWAWQELAVDSDEPGYLLVNRAYQDQVSDVLVEVSGSVIRVLADETESGLYQKFVITMPNGLDVQIVHRYKQDNRIPVRLNDIVTVRGHYQWNEAGGLINWTERDGLFSEYNGWVELYGKRYE